MPQGEVFITYMVRYVNRFLEETDRDRAYASLFGIPPTDLPSVRRLVLGSPNRELALRDYYMDRLKGGAGAGYTCAFRMFPEGGDQALYHLVHAATHPRALRLMKTTMRRSGTRGEFAFYGRRDAARRQQLVLLPPDDPEALKDHLVRSRAASCRP